MGRRMDEMRMGTQTQGAHSSPCFTWRVSIENKTKISSEGYVLEKKKLIVYVGGHWFYVKYIENILLF